MSFTIFWPIVPWFWQVLVIGWFLLVGVYLATATEEVYLVNGNCTCSDTQRFIENERCIHNFMILISDSINVC